LCLSTIKIKITEKIKNTPRRKFYARKPDGDDYGTL
jgi:hypothetical protein